MIVLFRNTRISSAYTSDGGTHDRIVGKLYGALLTRSIPPVAISWEIFDRLSEWKTIWRTKPTSHSSIRHENTKPAARFGDYTMFAVITKTPTTNGGRKGPRMGWSVAACKREDV